MDPAKSLVRQIEAKIPTSYEARFSPNRNSVARFLQTVVPPVRVGETHPCPLQSARLQREIMRYDRPEQQ